MATIVEQRSQPLGGYSDYDHMRLPGPHFTNPWGTSTGSAQQLYNPQPSQQQQQRHSHHVPDPYATRAHYSSPGGSSSLASVEPASQPRSFPNEYTSSAPNSAQSFTATSGDRYSSDHYTTSYNNGSSSSSTAATNGNYPPYQQAVRTSFRPSASGRDSFSDALDAGHGMVAMSQQDFTPRSTYPPRNGSSDSYGFPTGHSDHGSVSSGSSYPYYGSYSGSADGSVASSSATDYSSTSEDAGQRVLPPPGQLVNGYPADATQMMTQFNSKLAASAQKKHKCKICDKRFTRPSSLQTHMYSHTGEKPFACNFEGCGRHFSVVSNLRRHKKCHKGDGSVDSASPEE